VSDRIRTREKFRESGLTPKQAITILQRRCAIMMASSGKESASERLSERGEIRVTPVRKYGDKGFSFDMHEESNFEFRGRQRRETLWSIMIYVEPDDDGDGLDLGIYEDQNFDPIPANLLDCVTAPLTPSDRKLL